MPEPAGAAARFGCCTEPDDRVGALCGRSQQRSCHLVEAGQRGSHAGRVRPSRVHRVDHDPGARQLLCPHLGEDHLRAFGARVHGRPVELSTLALQVVDPDPLRVHAARGHVDDPRRGTFLKQWDQQVREQKRADDIGRERQLDRVGRDTAFLRHHTGVVDQHIEARTTIPKPSGEPVDRLDAAEVAVTHVHVAVTGALGDPHARVLAALRAAANQPHGGAQARKALSRGEAEPRAGTSDKHHLAVHLRQLRRAPAATPNAVANVRVATHHGAIKHAVEKRVDHALSESSLSGFWPERSGYAREVVRQRGLLSSSWTARIRRSANPASQ